MQTELSISKIAIATYVKPYVDYKSGFESRRSKFKSKMPYNFDDFNFEDPLFKHLNSTIDKVPQKFLQYDSVPKITGFKYLFP